MKRITIGRGRECDIRLEDSTDMVSRRQAVITVSPTGRMMIYDTSSNGTFVNGEKVEKPDGKVIKRGDQINFARVVDLDWSQVRDPYRTMKISLAVIFLAAVAVATLFIVFADIIGQKETQEETRTEKTDSIVPADSLKLQIPEETSVSGASGGTLPKKSPARRKADISDKKVRPEEIKKVEEKGEVPEPMPDPRLDKAVDDKYK